MLDDIEKIKTFVYLAKQGKTYKEISGILEVSQSILEGWTKQLKKQGLTLKVKRTSKAKEIFEEIAYVHSKNPLSQSRTENI